MLSDFEFQMTGHTGLQHIIESRQDLFHIFGGDDARQLFRRLVMRHPPANNAYAAARFIGQGYHDAYIRRLNGVLRTRRRAPGCEPGTPAQRCQATAVPTCRSEKS